MDHSVARATGKGSRFELAPPRRFVLPAVLLLLSEQPGYGYELVARLEEFHFGHVDRPAVYRALAQLEADGLAQAASESGIVGQARRVYRLTSVGQRTLRVWMGVIKEEHDYLGQVLRRYQATGTADAVLAEVEGGWASALSSGWSPVSSTLAGHRRLAPVGPCVVGPAPVAGKAGPSRTSTRPMETLRTRRAPLTVAPPTVALLTRKALALLLRAQTLLAYLRYGISSWSPSAPLCLSRSALRSVP